MHGTTPLSRLSRLRVWSRVPLEATPLSRHERALLVASFAVLVMMRLPHAWLQGRFIDEEGTIFFAYAWHRTAIDALFRSFGGYLNIGANASTLLAASAVRAGALPLTFAPYLTMLLALTVQLMPALLLVNGRARWLGHRTAVMASLIVLATAPMTEEVFVNVLHIQFHLALAAALILALDIPRTRGMQIAYCVPLVLAPLSGPGAIIVLPLFAARAFLDRDAGRGVQFTLFALATAAQLLIFFHPSPVRGDFLSLSTIVAILFVRLLAMPLFTSFAANAVGRAIYLSRLPDGMAWWWIVVGIGLVYFGWLVCLALRDRRLEAFWLLTSGLLVGVMSFGGGMIVADQREWFSVGAGERYNFLPLVLVSWGLIALLAGAGLTRPIRRVLTTLITLTLLSGAVTYAMPLD